MTDHPHFIRLIQEHAASRTHIEVTLFAFLNPFIDIYRLTGSMHLTEAASIALFLLGIFNVQHIIKECLNECTYRLSIVILLALHPAALFFCSIIMNESFEFFAITFHIRFLLRLLKCQGYTEIATIVLSSTLLALSHTAFTLIVLIENLLVATFLRRYTNFKAESKIKYNACICILYFAPFWLACTDTFMQNIYYNYKNKVQTYTLNVLDGSQSHTYHLPNKLFNVTQFSKNYTQFAKYSRTKYFLLEDKLIPNEFFRHIILFVSYIISPLAIEISYPVDFIAYSASWIRIALLIYLAASFHRIRIDRKEKLTLLFTYFVCIVIMSAATGTFGTAFRHHLISDWIILILSLMAYTSKELIMKRGIFSSVKLRSINLAHH